MNDRKTLKGRKLLGATLGLASLSLVGSACTSGNLVAPPDTPTDAPVTDAGTETDANKPADTGVEADTGQTSGDGGSDDGGT